MSIGRRKYIRIALSEDEIINFIRAKREAENKSGVAMTDTQFASGIVRLAIRAD